MRNKAQKWDPDEHEAIKDDEISYDAGLKILIFGDEGVGKTELLKQFLGDEYQDMSGVREDKNFHTKTVNLNDLNIRLQLWEMYESRMKGTKSGHARGASAAIVLFSLDDPVSFINCKSWINEEVNRYCQTNAPIVLVANKSDKKDRVAVDEEAVHKYVSDNDQIVYYCKTSAKSGTNIKQPFLKVVEAKFPKKEKVQDIKKEKPQDTKKSKLTHFFNKKFRRRREDRKSEQKDIEIKRIRH